MELYHIDKELDIPIYRQLVDELRADIRSGRIPADTQLPTVQELSGRLGVARGTVKRAYDELERERLLEKAQGRGTFASYRPPEPDSRKERAMAAIDELLDRLAEMELSMAEVNIFLKLKLRERTEAVSAVRVAVVECNPENLAQITEQLRAMEHTDLYSYLLDDILNNPYKLGGEMNLIVTTAEHSAALEKLLPDPQRLMKIALRLTPPCLAQIVKLRAGARAAILCGSLRFGELLRRACACYTERVDIAEPLLFENGMDCTSLLRDKDAVLVPEDFEKYADRDACACLEKLDSEGKLIRCAYQMDEGSFLYLAECLARLWEKKKI